jgi:hypothetical protein
MRLIPAAALCVVLVAAVARAGTPEECGAPAAMSDEWPHPICLIGADAGQCAGTFATSSARRSCGCCVTSSRLRGCPWMM